MSVPIPILVNASAGALHATQGPEAIRAEAATLGLEVDVILCDSAEEMRARLRAYVDAGAERVAVAGGDGTVGLAVQELAHRSTALGIIPQGTANNFAAALHLPQELDPADTPRLLADLRSLPDLERGRVFSVFGALGSDPERLIGRTDTALSPGEARKLALATGLGRHAWALFLDEPTNHLDLPTIERLESALEAYPGCIVLVTHDDAFAQNVVSRTLRVEGGAVVG
jgi:ATPase subunit of ABC transporter with duplicated ATPase domains